jgi:hypothetical protein
MMGTAPPASLLQFRGSAPFILFHVDPRGANHLGSRYARLSVIILYRLGLFLD